MKNNTNSFIYQLDGRPPLNTAILLGLQHVLAMFVGNVTPIIIIAGMLKLPIDQKAFLIQSAMLVSGVVSLIQCYPIGPVGAGLPIIMGTSFGFLPVCLAIASKYGLAGVLGATMIGGIFQVILGFFLKHLRKYFPPLITGIVLVSIGLSLVATGMKYFAGGVGGTGLRIFCKPHFRYYRPSYYIDFKALYQRYNEHVLCTYSPYSGIYHSYTNGKNKFCICCKR